MERMISPDRALELVLGALPPLRSETRELGAAVGRVLAEDLAAPEALPPFDRVMMDGYAVRTADAGRLVEVVGEVAAGQEPGARVEPGTAVSVMTGAPCPAGAEAVVPLEEVEREGSRVGLPSSVRPGQHVQPRGFLVRAGQRTLRRGDRIGPLAVANLAAFGRTAAAVFVPPAVAIVTTGDEIVPEGAARSGPGVRDANGPMLEAMAREAGAERVLRLHANDTEADLAAAFEAAAGFEVVVLTGGVSTGRYDVVPRAAEAAGFEVLFHKVRQKPGKPLLFGRRASGALLFGLPGNSRSTHFCFARYAAPAIRALSGLPGRPARRSGLLSRELTAKSSRTLFLPVRLEGGASGPATVELFDEKGSADVFTVASANAYLRLEPGDHRVEAGSRVEVLPLEDRPCPRPRAAAEERTP